MGFVLAEDTGAAWRTFRAGDGSGAATCAWDDDDEAAAGRQLPDEAEVLAQSRRVRHQVRRHGRLSFRLLEAAL